MSTQPLNTSTPARLEPPRGQERGHEVSRVVPSDAVDREVTFAALLAVIVRNRLVVAASTAIAVLIAVIIVAQTPTTYSTEVSFLPQGQQQTALSGLAAQLGLASGGGGSQSPSFYVELLNYRAILGRVADSTIVRPPQGRPMTLAQALHVDERDPVRRRSAIMGLLTKMVSPSVEARTGIVTLTVHAKDPDVAVSVANAFVEALVQFNTATRQSAAAAERQFVEQRRAEMKAELTGVEDVLKNFLKQNRAGNSPDLMFEQRRLEAEVTLRRDLYAQLSQAFERARMEEVRDTPLLTIIDLPERPLGPNRKDSAKQIILGLITGLFIGVVAAFLVEGGRVARAQWVQYRRETPAA
ncbi:MAG TPA: Wzz/FepE/Etk N-terminal domain-containing protein [Gemmatimonadaceae bacterium]|nr:Wzz/FepE/Etk N-terminal domain-containing protein [Gemmatimonadaceae bacterium]